jgi:hypothetical protein
VVAAEANDRRSPHAGLVAGDLLHQLGESLGVCAPGFVSARIEKRRNADGCGFGLILGHEFALGFIIQSLRDKFYLPPGSNSKNGRPLSTNIREVV